MNNIFKHSKMIELDEHFTLSPDGFDGIVLTFSEPRTRTKKDKTEEDFLFTDRWYYPNLGASLEKYVNLSQNNFKDLGDLKKIVEKTNRVVEEFKTKYKNW